MFFVSVLCVEIKKKKKKKQGVLLKWISLCVLSQHRRRAHPAEYHAQNVPTVRTKARWDHEELLLLGCAELVFRRSGVRNINQPLVEITPGRTLESIMGVHKGARYEELLAQLQLEADSRELLECATSGPNDGAPDEHPQQLPPDPPDHNVEWAAEVRDAIYDLGVPDCINIKAINPGSPTRETRDMLDAEYARWLPPLAGPRGRPPRRRAGAPRVRTGLPVRNARAKRRAAYACTERLYRTSRKRCARDVLSGTCGVEPSPVPMALQDPYWRGIFQQASLPDQRRP